MRMGQQITMTPQLQQAIRLLQLSTMDLQAEIQEALESNMMLEIDEGNDENKSHKEDKPLESDKDSDGDSSSQEVSLDKNEMPDELPIDSDWDDVYMGSSLPADPNAQDNRDFLSQQNTASESLQDHLLWQLDLTPFNDTDRAIALIIIDSINNDGYLTTCLDDIFQSVREDVEESEELSLEDVAVVLQRIQHFDPAGIGARDLRECLLLQLRTLDKNTPWLAETISLVDQHLDVLAAKDYAQLLRKTRLNRDDLQQVVLLVQSLNPRPGSKIAVDDTAYIIPDVFVKKIKGLWKVELNADIAPKLRVNPNYARLVSQMGSKAETNSLKSHLQEARWFIKSLKSRHETLLKVTRCIVQRQSAFLDYGEEAMKPLVLHDIATELDMHESTISRVTTQKYIHTPRGIFELKYFFSSHVSTHSGGECSSTAIRALIKKLIAAENAAKPLSDSKIADLLAEQGIKVARRTVAKYREAMTIPPSNERKCLV
jgi:RNA polymerase sigma-54 factor